MKTLGVPPARTALAAGPAPAPAPDSASDDDDDEDEPPPVEQAVRRPAGAPGTQVTVPSLAGLPARTAIRRLEDSDLAAELAGSGRVVSQSPPAGRAVGRGTRVRMTLAPAG
jgi:cell division protein FtsI (penicillin-binding protein 3)